MFRLIDICISRVAVRIWSGNELPALRFRKGDIDLVLCKLRQGETSLNVPRRPPRNTKFSLSLLKKQSIFTALKIDNWKKKKKFSRTRASKYIENKRFFSPNEKTKGKINSIQKNSFQEKQFPRDDPIDPREIKFLVLPPNRGTPNFSKFRKRSKTGEKARNEARPFASKRRQKNSGREAEKFQGRSHTRRRIPVEGRGGKGAKSKREKGAVVANQRPRLFLLPHPGYIRTRTTVEVT